MLKGIFCKFTNPHFFSLGSLLVFIFSSAAIGTEQNFTFRGKILENAGECTFVGDNSIIEFGDDVYIDKVNGTDYKKTKIPFELDCSDVSSVQLTIRIDATGTGLGCDKVLCTDHQGLGLKLYQNNSVLNVGEKIDFVVNANHKPLLLPSFYAVPVKINDVNLGAGKFSSMATVVLEAP